MSGKISQKDALEKARRFRGFAEDALKRLSDQSSDVHAMDKAWSDFVSDWDSGLEFCIKAANGGRTKNIADAIISARKHDAIIQYAFQSRNAEFHGPQIAEVKEGEMHVVDRHSGTTAIKISGTSKNIILEGNVIAGPQGVRKLPDIVGDFSDGTFVGMTDDPKGIRFVRSSFELLPARNRNVEYKVPQFEGVPDRDIPKTIAVYCIKYLQIQIGRIEKSFDG